MICALVLTDSRRVCRHGPQLPRARPDQLAGIIVDIRPCIDVTIWRKEDVAGDELFRL